MEKSFLAFIEQSTRENWDMNSLTDYKGKTLKYKDVARQIARLHLLFNSIGIKKGDKIAICGHNSSNWAVIFLATLTYGAVSVPILNDFKADNIHNIVNHSDSLLLFAGENIWERIDESSMPALKAIFSIADFSVLSTKNKKIIQVSQNLRKLMNKKYPNVYGKTDVSYHKDTPDELAYISYTSGTTSFSKGVMIPYRSLWSNIQYAHDNFPLTPGDGHVCMLPLAHAFGLLFSFLFEYTRGCRTYFLTRMPSPKIIFEAYQEVKPPLIITVPLIVEKIIKKGVLPKLETPSNKLMLRVPLLKEKVLYTIKKKISALFGGNFLELVIGGAAINEEVGTILREIHFPYTIGYGMTECGPLICYASAETFKDKSCGRPVDRMDVRINSIDPANIVGEVLVKGDNVMQGYYKNPVSTKAAFDDGGWMHTGDLALMDSEGNVTLKGRSKNMILGPSGQNIYPEEIEEKLNNMPYVAECIVVQRGVKIVALVHPDYDEALKKGLSSENMDDIMEQNRKEINEALPRYSAIGEIKIFAEEFEKTPKRSIKRYLYQ
jgi:long-chain acyl-CoA synthetase